MVTTDNITFGDSGTCYDLTLDGALTSTAGDPNAIVMASEKNFINHVSSAPLTVADGSRWLRA